MSGDVTFKIQFEDDNASPSQQNMTGPSGSSSSTATGPSSSSGPSSTSDAAKQLDVVLRNLTGATGFGGLYASIKKIIETVDRIVNLGKSGGFSLGSGPTGSAGQPRLPSGNSPGASGFTRTSGPNPTPGAATGAISGASESAETVVAAGGSGGSGGSAVTGAAGAAGGGEAAGAAALVNPVTIAVAAIAVAILLAAVAIKKVVDILDEEAKKIEKYSGVVSEAFGRADIRQTQVMMQRADTIGPDMARYVDFRSKLDQKMGEAWTQIVALLLKFFSAAEPALNLGLKTMDVANASLETLVWQVETVKDILMAKLTDIPEDLKKAYEANLKVIRAIEKLGEKDEEPDPFADPFLDSYFAGNGNGPGGLMVKDGRVVRRPKDDLGA